MRRKNVTPTPKTPKVSVVSKRIGMKFCAIVSEVNTHRLTKSRISDSDTGTLDLHTTQVDIL